MSYLRFLRLDPDKLVEITWITGKGGTEGRETILTIALHEENGTTVLTLNHAGNAISRGCQQEMLLAGCLWHV